MKRFSFKLESVLKYRKYQEKKAQMELGEARAAWMNHLNAVNALAEKKENLQGRLQKDACEGMDASWYLVCQNFASRLDNELDVAQDQLASQCRIMEERRICLENEYIKKESLDSLKSLYARQHRTQIEAEDQKSIDEMVLIRKRGMR